MSYQTKEYYHYSTMKVCEECGKTFETVNYRKRKCDACLFRKTLPKVHPTVKCSKCGEIVVFRKNYVIKPNKLYLCQDCKDYRDGILIDEISVNSEGEKICPYCGNLLVKLNHGYTCENQDCSVIHVRGTNYRRTGRRKGYRISRSSVRRDVEE